MDDDLVAQHPAGEGGVERQAVADGAGDALDGFVGKAPVAQAVAAEGRVEIMRAGLREAFQQLGQVFGRAPGKAKPGRAAEAGGILAIGQNGANRGRAFAFAFRQGSGDIAQRQQGQLAGAAAGGLQALKAEKPSLRRWEGCAGGRGFDEGRQRRAYGHAGFGRVVEPQRQNSGAEARNDEHAVAQAARRGIDRGHEVVGFQSGRADGLRHIQHAAPGAGFRQGAAHQVDFGAFFQGG